MKKILLNALLCLVALNLCAAPFSDLSFEAASQKAAQTGKIVFVDFYTTWCGPCRMLDKTTWTNAEVIQLLDQKTVAIRIDAEKETKLAERYKIEAYPSMLLIKPDGTELDRLVGYRNAQDFITDFNAALKGRDATTKAKERQGNVGTNSPFLRMDHALKLAQKGRKPEALDEYLWCFDHGDEVQPKFDGARLTLLLNQIKDLGGSYPPAKEALETRRDERQSKLYAGITDERTATELVYLNGALDQKERNLAMLDRLPAGSKARDAICGLIVEQLLDAKRYADVLSGQNADTKAAFAVSIELYNQMSDMLDPKNPVRETYVESYRKSTVASGAHLFEALAGAKKNDAGKELAQQILKFDASAATRDTLAEAATRAGNEELAEYVKK